MPVPLTVDSCGSAGGVRDGKAEERAAPHHAGVHHGQIQALRGRAQLHTALHPGPRGVRVDWSL